MSNPSDSKPNPDQPDPKKPDEGKTGRTPTGASSFDFQLPDEGSYSDLPPVPQPDGGLDATGGHAALPPRPTTIRPSSGSFDFIDLGDVDPSTIPPPAVQSLPPAPTPVMPPPASIPEPPPLTPTEGVIALPLEAATPAEGDSALTFALPAPTSDGSSFTLSAEPLDLANLPELPELPTAELADAVSVPDIATLFPSSDPPSSFVLGQAVQAAPAAPDSSGSFVLPPPEVAALPDPGPPSTPDVSTVLPPQIPTADPGSFVGGTPAMADLALPVADPGSDVFSSHPPVTATPTPDLESVVGDLNLPLAESGSDIIVTPTPNLDSAVSLGAQPPPVVASSGWLGYSSARREAAEAESRSETTPVPEAVPATPTPDLDAIIGNQGLPTATPTPNLESVVDLGLSPPPAVAVSGWLGYSSARRQQSEAALAEEIPTAEVTPVAEAVPPATPVAAPDPTGRSSFDFALPQGVTTFSDLPAPPQPYASDPSDPALALPPRPEARRVDSQTFDLIDLGDVDQVPDSGVGLSKPPAASAPAAPTPAPTASTPSAPLLTPTDGVINIPPADDADAVLGNLEPVDPVAPASGWLDSDVLLIPKADPEALIPTAEPTAGTFDPPPAEVIESSDIFSGGRAAPALPVEQSDVIAATAYGTATPADLGRPGVPAEPSIPARPSDIALTFEGPPGGSTLPDGGSGELPIADEVSGSSTLLGAPPADDASIHDMPDPASADPLFDSAKLAETPDLPDATPAVPPRATNDDATDYGLTPVHSADASSILADLDDPKGPPGADSSSVRVEAPGVDRTLTGSPAEGAFDLTVSDEPIPADLFGEPSDGTIAESTDWQSQSGSDLFAEGRTAPEIDLEADRTGTVEPVDAELTSDQPSLTSAPSSIFSGDRPAATGSSSGSANVRIGQPESPSDLPDADLADADLSDAELTEADFVDADAAEFSAHPALNDSAERPSAPSKMHKASSGDFELPAVVPPAPAPVEDDGGAGAIDWDAAAILQDDDNATRGIPKDASLSAIMRGLTDDSAESSTREGRPVTPAAPPAPAATPSHAAEQEEETETPMVTVDWMAGSVEASAVSPALEQEAKASPAKPKDKGKDRREQEREQDEPKAKPKEKAKDKEKERTPKVVPLLDADAGSEEVETPAPKAKPSRGKERKGEDSTREKAKTKPEKDKKGGGMLVGLLLGGVLAGGAAAGVYFSGLVPNEEKQTAGTQKPGEGTNPNSPNNPNPGEQGGNPQQPPPPPVTNDARVALATGDVAKALELVKAKPATTAEEKAIAGSVRVFAKVQELGKTGPNATAAIDDADLKQARVDLKAVVDDPEAGKSAAAEKRAVAAMVQLGVSHEVAGDAAEARKVFEEGKAKFPKHAAVFEALLERLDSARKPGASFRMLTPEDAQRVLFAMTVLLADDPAKADDDPEPGLYYWKAVNNAAIGKYDAAIKLIGEAKAAHVKRAKALAGRGLNPLTDPLEQMFSRSCDELASYWKLRDELYKNPAVADAIKKDGVEKTLTSLVKAQSDLTTAQVDLKAANDKLTKLGDDIKKLGDDVKAAEKARTEAEDKLKTAMTDLKDANQKVTDRETLIQGVVAELKDVAKLPDKWAPAELIAAVKTVAARGTGPDLKKLVPDAMTAIGGGGLSTGQLLDIAARLTKAEDAAKAATDKLAAETKAFKEKYDTDTAKLKTDHTAELKKLTDGYATDLKKLTDDHAAAVKKIKDDNAAETKKATDKFALDVKKLTDDRIAAEKKLKEDSDAALAKLKADSDTAIKAEQAKTEAEKKASVAKEISFQKQLANAVTPAQAMDIWLPMLTDLRRVSDTEPAMATAARALASVLPESEDAAKAHTVNGMSLLLKGNLPAARDEFQLARKNPTYPAAKDKAAWAKAADAGLDAVDDPLAPYRKPVVTPPVDLKAAAKSLDNGIAAYKAGKYEAAVTALADAAKNDPSDPVAWYYLGAARWATGDAKQAEKDIGQGAEREKVSTVPGRTVSAALAPIQGTPRDVIDKVRP